MKKLLALLFLAAALPVWGKPPRLTLLIVVDSMGTDLFLRARPHLRGALNQLSSHGAFFPYARYDYAETATAPGHATLATGANPWRHGVVANRIFDRAAGRWGTIYSDPLHPILEAPPTAEDTSPGALLTETIADRIRLFTQRRGKAIAVGGKARATIALAGKLGQAFWFNTDVGKFVTGTYYAKEFPGWIKALNQRRLADAWWGRDWMLSLAPSEYVGEDDRSFEGAGEGMGRTFPHQISGKASAPGPAFYEALSETPLMNELIVRAAQAAIEGEQLGRDEIPDLLAVAMSPLDFVFHRYGPYSWEVQDAMVKLDRSLSDLLSAAEKAAGKGNLLVVVSADHGGGALPAEWASMGSTAGRMDARALKDGLNQELHQKYGQELVAAVGVTSIYLNSKLIAERKLDPVAVRRTAAQWLNTQPPIGIAVARDDLAGGDPAQGYLRSLQRGYFAGRSGDILFVLKPFHEIESTEAVHGTPHSYDSEVPVIFSGKGVRSGWYPQNISPTDVAPTIAAILEMGAPASSEGRVLAEALAGLGH